MTPCNDAYANDHRERQFTRMLTCGIVLLGLVVFGILALRFVPYTLDDSYISFRYACNLAAGHGLVFNPGEYPRAEGITSPLYAAILSVAPLAGVDIVVLSKCLGAAACAVTAVLLGAVVYRLTRSLTSLCRSSAVMLCCSGAAYFLSNPYVVGNAVSGMETSLAAMTFALFLFLTANCLLSGKQATRFELFCLGFVAALVPMFRPEMGLSVVCIFATAGWLWSDARASVRRSAGVFLVLGAAYYGLRFFYYGLPLPLPFLIKQGPFGLNGIKDLEAYLKHAIVLLPFVFACFAFGLGPHRDGRKPACLYLLTVLLAAGAQLAYYATLVHIMGFGFRYFQPIAVAVVLLAFTGAAILYEVARQSRLKASFSIPALYAAFMAVAIGSNVCAYHPAAATFIHWYAAGMRTTASMARCMQEAAHGAPFRIAMNDCGVVPFVTGFSTVDLAGLNNRAIALGGTSQASLNEIREKRSQLVVLVAGKAHDPMSLLGYERLSHDDVLHLGYHYVGTLPVGQLPDGTGYHYLVYANSDPSVLAFLDRLTLAGAMVRPLGRPPL